MLKRIRYPLPGESNEVLWPEVYGPSADPRGAASPLITIQETKNQEQRERERAYNAEAKEDFLRRRMLPRQAEPFELSEQEQERERERAAERQRLRELRFRARVGENTRDLTALGQVEEEVGLEGIAEQSGHGSSRRHSHRTQRDISSMPGWRRTL